MYVVHIQILVLEYALRDTVIYSGAVNVTIDTRID
jgi:hypothetical protein